MEFPTNWAGNSPDVFIILGTLEQIFELVLLTYFANSRENQPSENINGSQFISLVPALECDISIEILVVFSLCMKSHG